jgi:hypothetical protein
VALPFRRVLYAPLVLLHPGLIARVAGDAGGDLTLWRWGGIANELAIVGYIGLAAAIAVRAARRRTRAVAARRVPPQQQVSEVA